MTINLCTVRELPACLLDFKMVFLLKCRLFHFSQFSRLVVSDSLQPHGLQQLIYIALISDV